MFRFHCPINPNKRESGGQQSDDEAAEHRGYV